MGKNFKSFAWISVLIFITGGCGSSRVFTTEDTNAVTIQAGFDPSVSTNLKVLHYNALLSLLQNTFDLSNNSTTIEDFLEPNETIFGVTSPSPVYITNYIKLMASACSEVDDDAGFFPDGVSIDHVWKLFTGKTVDEDAEKLETDTLAQVASQPDDVKKYALCFAAATDSMTMYTNLVKMKFPTTTAE